VGKAEEGEVTFLPYDVIQGRFKISLSELSFSQRQKKIAKAQFTLIEISSHCGPYTGKENSY